MGSRSIKELKIGDIIVLWVLGTKAQVATTSTHYLSSINISDDDHEIRMISIYPTWFTQWFKILKPFAAIVNHWLFRKKGRYLSRRAPENSRVHSTIGRTCRILCIFQNWFPVFILPRTVEISGWVNFLLAKIAILCVWSGKCAAYFFWKIHSKDSLQ